MASRIYSSGMSAAAPWIVFCVLLTGVPAAIATTSPASQSVSSAEQARLDRGQKVRRILLETLDQSYRDNGRWPEHPVVLQDERPPLAYVRPEPEKSGGTRDALAHAARFAAVTVTMHEPFEQNPSGVWVGYQDGHLEFALTPQDLAAFQKQREWVVDPPAAATTQPAPTIDAYLTSDAHEMVQKALEAR